MNSSISFKTEDRQWDCRINVQCDDYLKTITENIMLEDANGKFKYILIGGLEIGTRPNQSDYQTRHIHIAVIFNNRASKSSILKNWGIIQGNGYYLVPRNRELPYSGWRDHHIKEFSKVDPKELIIYESGVLPADIKKEKVEKSSEEKKRKVDEILVDMRHMLENNQDEAAFKKYPRNYIIYGSRIKSMVMQKLNFFGDKRNPHIYVYGFPGSGKTAVMKYVYPNYYKKDLQNRFFDLYDEKIHTHIMLEDLDHECVERLGIQFLKTICDEAGFPIDQKYKTPQLTRSTILITSNFPLQDLIPEGTKGCVQTIEALNRRFWHVRIDNFLRVLGLRLIDKWDRKRLQQEGNEDFGKLFLSYDYTRDCPTGLPIKTPEECQQLLRDEFYK